MTLTCWATGHVPIPGSPIAIRYIVTFGLVYLSSQGKGTCSGAGDSLC